MDTRRRRAERAYQYESRAYRQLQRWLAYNVREARARLDWSQEETAHNCDMSTRLFQKIEAGENNWTAVTLARLVQGLGVNASDLLKPKKRRARKS